jgi:uncharacterized protein with GYD domain
MKGDNDMATYFMFGKYSQVGVLKAGYALLGDVDLVLIMELPDAGQAMKTSAALAKLIGASFSTAQALSMEEFDKLIG